MQLAIYDLALIGIYVTILILTLYGVALGYHLLTYGEKRSSAMTALIIYSIGSSVLIIGLIVAFNLFS